MNWPVTNEASFPVRNKHEPDEVLGRPEARDRLRTGHRIEHLLRKSARRHVDLHARSARKPRRDGVDGDPMSSEVVRQRAREPEHAALARHVRDEPRRRREKGRRRDVDDPPVAPLDHSGSEGLRKQELRLQVDAERLTELVVVELEERGSSEQRSVVDEHVAAPDLRGDARDVVRRADVGDERAALAPRGGDRLDRLPRVEHVDRDDGGAAGAKPFGDRASDASRGAGDDRDGSGVGGAHARGRPPSSARTLPVVNVRSRTTARTAAATSSGDASRPSGVRASWSSRHAGSSDRMKPVSTTPGETETTLIRGASARPSERVMLSSAAFDAQ